MFSRLLGEKGKDLEGLFKNSIKLIGHDKDLLVPMAYMAFYRSITVVLGFSLFYFAFVQKNPTKVFMTFLALLGYAPLSSFLQVRHQAALSWMTFEVLQGKDTDLDSGMSEIKGLQFKLFLVGMVNYLTQNRSSSESQTGVKDMIVQALVSVFAGVWDLLQNFLVPSLVIEKASFSEAADKLKQLKTNIPASIAGVLAVDVTAGLVSALLGPITGFGVVLGGGLGYFGTNFLPAAWNLPIENGPVVNALPLFCVLFVSLIISSIILAMASGLKAIYYSTFYVSLNHPMEIRDDMRPDVTNYLNFKGKTKQYDFFARFKNSGIPEAKKLEISSIVEVDQATMEKLKKAFNTNFVKGHKSQTISEFLLKKGYKSQVIEAALSEYMEEETAKILPFVKEKLAIGHSKNDLGKFLAEKGVPAEITMKVLKAV